MLLNTFSVNTFILNTFSVNNFCFKFESNSRFGQMCRDIDLHLSSHLSLYIKTLSKFIFNDFKLN